MVMSMNLREVETIIVEGRAPDEQPADLLFMTNAVGAVIDRDAPYIPIRQRFPIPESVRSGLAAATYAAGLLICPIFDPVKHETYSYAMIEARRRYHGISHDPLLRHQFRENVAEARRRGALRTLESAMDLGLPEILARGTPNNEIEQSF
jgi:hypothetical protein